MGNEKIVSLESVVANYNEREGRGLTVQQGECSNGDKYVFVINDNKVLTVVDYLNEDMEYDYESDLRTLGVVEGNDELFDFDNEEDTILILSESDMVDCNNFLVDSTTLVERTVLNKDTLLEILENVEHSTQTS